MLFKVKPVEPLTQHDRSRRLRELVLARIQFAMLRNLFRDDITLGWYDLLEDRRDGHYVSKFRRGALTWPNVLASSHEGKLFVKFDGDEHWREVLGEGFSNRQLMEMLRDIEDGVDLVPLVELLLYELFDDCHA